MFLRACFKHDSFRSGSKEEHLTAPTHRRSRRVICVLLFCLMSFLPASVRGEPLAGAEYKVKVGFIYHFIRFTQWPPETFASPESPIVFYVASKNPAADIMFSLENKEVKGRKIHVRKYAVDEDIGTCQAFFIASDDETFVLPILAQIQGRQILSIGEIEDFTRMGGIINFFVTMDQLRFAVNLDAAEAAGLKFSSQLLMSADIVQKREE